MGLCLTKEPAVKEAPGTKGAVSDSTPCGTTCACAAAAKDQVQETPSAQLQSPTECCGAATCAATDNAAAECPVIAAEAEDIVVPPSCSTPLARHGSEGQPLRSAMRSSIDGGDRPSTAGGVSLGRKSHSSEGSSASRVRFAAESAAGARLSPDYHRPSCDYSAANSVSLKKIVDMFYDKVLADPRLSPFFLGIDVPKLKSHQVKFMALAFGGKELVVDEHPDLNLRRIHYRLIRDRGLTEEHWQWFFDRFQDTLMELPEIPRETKDKAITSVAATRVYFTPLSPEEEAAGRSIAPSLAAEAAASAEQ